MFNINISKEIESFILALEVGTQAKVIRSIDLLEEFGYSLRMPHSKKISNQLYELRIRGKQEVRIFYCYKNNQAYLLNGFVKSSQKTPRREIDKALTRISQLT